MITLKCPLCGSENFITNGYKANDKPRRRFQCKICNKYFYNSSKICQNCFTALPKGRKSNHCEECSKKRNKLMAKKYFKKYQKDNRKKINKNQKKYYKKKEKQIFCEMTGITRDRYLELKKFMGIK